MSDRRRVNAPLVQSYRRTDPPGCRAGARARRGPVAAALELSQAVSGVEARGADVRHVPNVRLCAASTCWRPISDGERRKPFGRFEDQLGTGPSRSKTGIVRRLAWVRAPVTVETACGVLGSCTILDSDLARRVRKWVEETTRAQGLSVHVTDPVALQDRRDPLAGGAVGEPAQVEEPAADTVICVRASGVKDGRASERSESCRAAQNCRCVRLIVEREGGLGALASVPGTAHARHDRPVSRRMWVRQADPSSVRWWRLP